MSVRELLNTTIQPWSNVYCDSLNTLSLGVTGPINATAGFFNLVTTSNFTATSNTTTLLTVTTTGTINNLLSSRSMLVVADGATSILQPFNVVSSYITVGTPSGSGGATLTLPPASNLDSYFGSNFLPTNLIFTLEISSWGSGSSSLVLGAGINSSFGGTSINLRSGGAFTQIKFVRQAGGGYIIYA
jgi:hypothetical protein